MTTPTEREALRAWLLETASRSAQPATAFNLLKAADMLESDAQEIDELKKKVTHEKALGDIHFAECIRLGEQQVAVAHEPNNDEVICPQCCAQFRAIPVNVQGLMLAAGFEPPFKAAPQPPQQVAVPQITEAAIDEYLADYMLDDGDTRGHTPSEAERFLIKDAIMGLLAAAPQPPRGQTHRSSNPAEQRQQFMVVMRDFGADLSLNQYGFFNNLEVRRMFEGWQMRDHAIKAAPQPPQPEPRKPMTEDEIMDATRPICREFRWPSTAIDIARALESMHSIKEQP